MKFSELSDDQFEDLADKMYDDQDLINEYIEENYENFEEYMLEHGVHHDDYCDWEINYVESRSDELLELAVKKYYGDT
jgi:hypothetical protein